MKKKRHTPKPIIFPTNLRNLIVKIAERSAPGSGKFVCGILQDFIGSIRSNHYKYTEGWVQRSSQQLKGIEWDLLADTGIGSRPKGPLILEFRHPILRVSRRSFRPSERLIVEISSYIEGGALAEFPVDFCELVSGKPVKNKIRSKGKHDDGSSYPTLISSALRSIQPRPFSRTNISSHLFNYRADNGIDRRYLNDLFCWIHILSQKPKHLDGDIWEYIPAYTLQTTGRVGEIGGGLQSCTREMKAASAKGTEVHNYDLKSSQPSILKQLLEDADMSSIWLNDYLDGDKSDYAAGIGITVDCWKELLMAMIFGAGQQKLESICINHDYGADEYSRFSIEVDELSKALKRFKRYLTTRHIKTHGFTYKGRRGIRNKTGLARYLDDLKKGKGNQLLAFHLQGLEATFIHHLTVLGKDHGYVVVSNEHDGIVTLNEIPSKAIEVAASLSGLKNPTLGVKPFL
jgi:hypothetical protein